MNPILYSMLLTILVPAIASLCTDDAGEGLQPMFYSQSCPSALATVRSITWNNVAQDPQLAAKLLRLHFHDCFVRGCDASVLIDSTPGNSAEKDAVPNQTLAGFDVIDQIKAALEEQCPGVVSCADIVALAARDAVSYQYKRPLWPVFTGRRDGNVSLATEAVADMPKPSSNFSVIQQQFASNGLDIMDLVVLSGKAVYLYACIDMLLDVANRARYKSVKACNLIVVVWSMSNGAHTIGQAHCAKFSARIYNFTGVGDMDPSLNPTYANYLKAMCPINVNPNVTVDMDPRNSLNFNNHYYQAVLNNKGLFVSDAALITDPRSTVYVNMMTDPEYFFTNFATSIMKMGKISILIGQNGEIRKNCRVIN
ncbi:Peroxidase 24-like protein [Drosera capensis]